MNTHRPRNNHVSINTKSCPDDNATQRRNRNRETNNEQPQQAEKSNNERRINSAHAVMYASRGSDRSNPHSEKADAITKRANLISVQRQLPSIFSNTGKEKREVKWGLVRRGDYYTQGNNTTHVHGADLCDEKLRTENRLNSSGRKTNPSLTIRTHLTQKRDVLLRQKNNNSWDLASKRKVDREEVLENKRRKPSHSHDRGGYATGSAISCGTVADMKEQRRGEEAEHPRRSGTGEGGRTGQAGRTVDVPHVTHPTLVGSIGGSLPMREQTRRDELGGGNPGMGPCVRSRTSERTSQETEERLHESSAFPPRDDVQSDDVEEVSLKGGSRRDYPWGMHRKPRGNLSHGFYAEVVTDDENTTVGTIPKGDPPNREEVDGRIKCKEQRGREEKGVRAGQADQREAPLNRDTSISAIKEGDGKEGCIHSREDSSLFRQRSIGEERKDNIAVERTDDIVVEKVSRWIPHPASRDKCDERDKKALPGGGHTQEGSKKGLHGTHLFTEIKKAYEGRVSDDLLPNHPMKKTADHDAERKNELLPALRRRGELSSHNFSDDSEVEKELRRTYRSAQREEAPPPNRRFAAHTLSSNSKNIKTIKGNFKQAEKKGIPASQKMSAIPRVAATQLRRTDDRGMVQNEGQRKNIIFASGQMDRHNSRATFTRGFSRREGGMDTPGGADKASAPGGAEPLSCHLATRLPLPKKEKDRSDKIPEVKKSYGPLSSSRGMATHGRNLPGVEASVIGTMKGQPWGGPKMGAKESTNQMDDITKTVEGPTPLLPRTNLVVVDEERIKRHKGIGGNRGIQSHKYVLSRRDAPSRGQQAKTTDVGAKRNPREQHSSNMSSISSSSGKTSGALLSSASSSSLRGSKVCARERREKITSHLYTQSSRNALAKDGNTSATTKRNNSSSHNNNRSNAAPMSKRSANTIGSNSHLSKRIPVVPISKCRGKAPGNAGNAENRGKSGNQEDASKIGSADVIESRRNAEEKHNKDEPLRCNLTHFANSKKGTQNSHQNYKDPISEEMERHKREQKKKKNVKSNSIPPRNMNRRRRSDNSNNIFLGGSHDCGGEGEDGEGKKKGGGNRASSFRKRSDSYDERGKHSKGGGSTSDRVRRSCDGEESSPAKNTLSDNSRMKNSSMQDSSSSASQRERKEMSYFEWLAKEKRKKEEGISTGEASVVGEAAVAGEAASVGAAPSAEGGSANAEDTPRQMSEKNPLSDALQDEHYHLMLQPLSAFNLKQNERNYEQDDFIVDKNPIGNGRTGLVFKAIIKKANEYVALKVMAKDTIASLNIERQVLKEIIIQASLNHKNILQLIAYFEDRTRLFLILELANGGSIRNKMKSDAQPLPEEQVALYVYQIADALAYLHKFNIIHRDLKPDNILLHHSHDDPKGDQIYKYGTVKIADFGFSCQLKNKRQKRSTFCGTVDYMPPEIINQIPYDCNVDLWCLGIVIFELLVGFPPFTDDTQERIFSQIKELNFHFPKAISLQARDLILKPLHLLLLLIIALASRARGGNPGGVSDGGGGGAVFSRDFDKDMSELDLSGLEEEIEGIDEIAHKDYYQYVTQLYVYVRVDEKYRTFRNHLSLIRLGEKYMTLLQNAMMNVQMKKTGLGILTCFYQDKAITENLVTYFLMQKEVDFLEVGFDRRFPEGRSAPIVDVDGRSEPQNKPDEEL
ncbi:AUR protein kinase [Plasmodium inui San Antonio 1]|uniref:Aurora kinase n=1 Tax=Plasmodium inui San Antonio 1 TaxID=1237626 RepID=W6ZY04_9APIC|nr:AUR protein kinase [Plasmodium inui San Antonio 1]EUD65677.1 AUR protein kinase [Plasmodium inui San Antonio 1]